MNSIKFLAKSVSIFAAAAIVITAFTKEPLRLWLLTGAFPPTVSDSDKMQKSGK